MKIMWYHFLLLLFFSFFFPLFFYPPHTTAFLSSLFSFFSPSFFLLHTRTLTLFFFYLFPLFIPTTSSNLQNVPALLLPLFFFFFSFLPFSLFSKHFICNTLAILHPDLLDFFFFSKFNHLQTGWFRLGRLDQSRANTEQTGSDQIEKCLQELIRPLGETLQLLLQTSIIHPPQDGYKLHLKDFAIF